MKRNNGHAKNYTVNYQILIHLNYYNNVRFRTESVRFTT